MKRRQRTILKLLDRVLEEARGNGHKEEQEQVQRLKKVHLEKDEFTQHKVIEDALVTFVVEARQLEDHYQGHRKRMIQTVALALADELDRIGKSDLICHISEELMKVLKQAGIKWNAIYLRRCLDERYKNPVNRLNALARKTHPGVPEDTGKTEEELEKQLTRKPKAVKTSLQYVKNLKFGGDVWEWQKGFMTQEKVGPAKMKVVLDMPVIVEFSNMGQDARVTIDEARLNAKVKEVADMPVKEWSNEKDQSQ
jgi:hypothetical protein